MMQSFDYYFEKFSNFFSNHEILSNELVLAREEYFLLTGKINEGDESFTNRMNAFLLWFTFDWTCKSLLKTPFEVFKEDIVSNTDMPDLINILNGFDNHIHSIFESLKMKGSIAIVRDLFTKTKYEIAEPDFLFGSMKGTCFETRLFQIAGKLQFSNYFIQHPPAAIKPIKKRCKQIRKGRESTKPFLITLHSYHTKWERYRNIDIKNIYHFDKSVPEAK